MNSMADSSITADHPLLDKFQKTLREYLLRITAQLETETDEIDKKIAELNEERIEIGSNLYDFQQEIDRQKDEIDLYNNRISDLFERRTKCETENREAKDELKLMQDSLKNAKRLQCERLSALDKLQMVEQNIVKWQQEMEHELKVSKLMRNKDKKEKERICKEKRQMDLLLLNLEMEIRRQEAESHEILSQIKDAEQEISMINAKLANTNADLDDLQCDNRRIISTWNDVIHAISKRDQTLALTNDNLMLVERN